MKTRKSRGMIFYIILGVLSLVWFLVRVVPRPSRITYPCQRLAAANAAGFITWLFGTLLTLALFKNARKKLRESRYATGYAMLTAALAVLVTAALLPADKNVNAGALSRAQLRADERPFQPVDGSNNPVGTARGIFPGRVAWAHDPQAVQFMGRGLWWDDENTIPGKVDTMYTYGLDAITGATRQDDGWDALFRFANERMGKGDFGYIPGEKIAIKVNLVMGLAGGKDKSTGPGPTPQLLHAIIRDLIEDVGFPGADITVFDVSARIPDYIMEPFKNHENEEYRNIKFIGNPLYVRDAGETEDRYTAAREDLDHRIWFADTTVTSIYLVKSVTESDYLINLTNLKAHTMAGVTMLAKNLYSAIFISTATREGFWKSKDHPDYIAEYGNNYSDGFAPKNVFDSLGNLDPHGGLHKNATVHDFQDGNVGYYPMRDYGTHNYLVDIMGHPQIYDKTVLYIIDAMYAGDIQNSFTFFESFGNKYTASILMSQDPIALESVGLDILRNEPRCDKYVHGNVDNWLHESAQAGNPPSGLSYDPEGGGAGLTSLGVHEHWNNADDKQYSRNLGTGDGIELYRVGLATGIDPAGSSLSTVASLLPNYPNPFLVRTTIPFELTRSTRLRIDVFDQAGRLIENLTAGEYPAGNFSVHWEPAGAQAGVYFCRLTTSHGIEETIQLQKLQ